MAHKGRMGHRVERAMDLPGGTLSGGSFIELEDNRRLVITGCKGIRSYTDDCIAVATPGGVVTVYGQGMEMGCLSEDGATVTGCIQRIELAREGSV